MNTNTPQQTVLGDTLAKGLARSHAREVIDRIHQISAVSARQRFGPVKRAIEAKLHSIGAIPVVHGTIAKRNELWIWLIPSSKEPGAWSSLLIRLNAKSRPLVFVGGYFAEVSLHAAQRALQSNISMDRVGEVVGHALMGHVPLAPEQACGWFASEEALWRFDQGILKTVIRSDRLDHDKARIHQRAMAANGWAFDDENVATLILQATRTSEDRNAA